MSNTDYQRWEKLKAEVEERIDELEQRHELFEDQKDVLRVAWDIQSLINKYAPTGLEELVKRYIPRWEYGDVCYIYDTQREERFSNTPYESEAICKHQCDVLNDME